MRYINCVRLDDSVLNYLHWLNQLNVRKLRL